MATSVLLRFYETPTETTDLGRRTVLAAELPSDPHELGEVVRGVLIHNYQVKVRSLELPAERMSHMQTVGAERILDNVIGLDASPLAVERPLERRMVGWSSTRKEKNW